MILLVAVQMLGKFRDADYTKFNTFYKENSNTLYDAVL